MGYDIRITHLYGYTGYGYLYGYMVIQVMVIMYKCITIPYLQMYHKSLTML